MIKSFLVGLVMPPVAATAIAAATEASPFEYGLVGLVLIIGLIPIIRWMMKRLDEQQAQAMALAERREEREDKNLVVISEILKTLSALTESNRVLLVKLESLPRDVAAILKGG